MFDKHIYGADKIKSVKSLGHFRSVSGYNFWCKNGTKTVTESSHEHLHKCKISSLFNKTFKNFIL